MTVTQLLWMAHLHTGMLSHQAAWMHAHLLACMPAAHLPSCLPHCPLVQGRWSGSPLTVLGFGRLHVEVQSEAKPAMNMQGVEAAHAMRARKAGFCWVHGQMSKANEMCDY